MIQMKRFIVFALLIVSLAMTMNAMPMSEDSARVIAARVLSFSSAPKGKKLIHGEAPSLKRVSLPQSIGLDELVPCYVFTRSSGNGFAIIAADDAVAPLIGYSLDGTFRSDSLPCALKHLLSQGRISGVNCASGAPRNKLGPTEPGNVVVAPHIATQWNQGTPYNWLTPTYTSNGKTEHYVTGCVPTAAAQVMNYYRWPQASYYRPYDWGKMRNVYSYTVPYTHQEGMAVATLARDLGVMMGSSYSSSGTSTYVPSGYLEIPGYKSTRIKTLDEVKEFVAKGPVFISIGGGISHAVIVDGLDDNDFYHVNWGWGGQCDGYYNLKDMGIMYGDREVHPSIKESYSVYIEPDDQAAPVSLAAAGGVTVDCAQATAGQEVTVTLHGLKQVSGSPFSGFLGLHVTNGKNSYDDYYTATTGRNGKTGFASDGSFPTCRVPWDASRAGEDVSITFTMEEMTREGTWYIVPISCDLSEGNGENKSEYHQLALYTDDFIDNNVTFNWSNNVATFKASTREDYDLDVKSIITASSYRRDGRSQLVAQAVNNGATTFNGTISLSLTATDGKSGNKTVVADLSIPAGGQRYCVLTTTFNFTGKYRVAAYELSRTSQSGDVASITMGDITSEPFEVLPATKDVDGANLTYDYSVTRSYSNIYACEENSHIIWAYAKESVNHVDIDNVDMEFVASPLEGGVAQRIAHYDNMPIQALEEPYVSSIWVPFDRHDLETGSYAVVGFIHYGNTTGFIRTEEYFNQIVAANTEDLPCLIINVLDPGVEIPKLKILGYKPLGPCYLNQYNAVALHVENTGNIDATSHFNTVWLDGETHMWVDGEAFMVKAGEKGTLYPVFYKYIETGQPYKNGRVNLCYIVNNGERDLTIPFDGDNEIVLDFEDQPTNRKVTYNNTIFCYRNSNSVIPHGYTYWSTPANIQRTIYQDGKVLLKLPDLSLTSRGYFTPTAEDLKTLPVGTGFWMVAEITDLGASEPNSILYFPLHIYDEESLRMDDVNFIQSHDLDVNDELPFFVKATNLTDKPIVAQGYFNLYKLAKDASGTTIHYSATNGSKDFAVNLPVRYKKASQFSVKVEEEEQKSDGRFEICVTLNRHHYTGMADYVTKYAYITLPFKSTGVTEVDAGCRGVPVAYYDLQGRQLSQPAPGVNIVKMSDGTTQKILMK